MNEDPLATFDYMQMFGNSALTDPNVNGNSSSLPFTTSVPNLGSNTATVTANPSSSFWDTIGSSMGGIVWRGHQSGHGGGSPERSVLISG